MELHTLDNRIDASIDASYPHPFQWNQGFVCRDTPSKEVKLQRSDSHEAPITVNKIQLMQAPRVLQADSGANRSATDCKDLL